MDACKSSSIPISPKRCAFSRDFRSDCFQKRICNCKHALEDAKNNRSFHLKPVYSFLFHARIYCNALLKIGNCLKWNEIFG